MNFQPVLHRYRNQYMVARRTLPWLDASYWPDDPPAFKCYALSCEHEVAKAAVLRPGSAGTIRRQHGESGVSIWRWLPDESGHLAELEPVIGELTECKLPMAVRQTDLTFHELETFALTHPRLPVILESGERKLLYHIQHIEAAMLKCPNLYLSTYNFCNWLGLERFRSKGLLERLVFGSHAPRYSQDASMGPIVISACSWKDKCAIAGNNLRRLLRLPPAAPPQQAWPVAAPFIIDAHLHNIVPGTKNLFGFPTPDEHFSPADWIANMNLSAIAQAFFIPANALTDKNAGAREAVKPLLRFAPAKVRYMTVFHPAMDKSQCNRVAAELADETCVGLKIHPAMHKLDAEHPDFAKAYIMAESAGKPIVSHSWEISDYNPVQKLSHPERFRKHLSRHPQVTLVLGHAGGRPAALDSVAGLCRDFPKTMVDISGDYFDNGMVDCLADRLGTGRIMFGSDVDWIDQRCNLGPVLASKLPDKDVMKILRDNARRVFCSAELSGRGSPCE